MYLISLKPDTNFCVLSKGRLERYAEIGNAEVYFAFTEMLMQLLLINTSIRTYISLITMHVQSSNQPQLDGYKANST